MRKLDFPVAKQCPQKRKEHLGPSASVTWRSKSQLPSPGSPPEGGAGRGRRGWAWAEGLGVGGGVLTGPCNPFTNHMPSCHLSGSNSTPVVLTLKWAARRVNNAYANETAEAKPGCDPLV